MRSRPLAGGGAASAPTHHRLSEFSNPLSVLRPAALAAAADLRPNRRSGRACRRPAAPYHDVVNLRARTTAGWLAATLALAAPAQPAADAVSAWRRNLACQAALDRAGFSPGLIDGVPGRKTMLALRAFQAARGVPVTGEFDPRTLAALEVDAQPATLSYRIADADLRDVGPVPSDWNEKARQSRLHYETLAALLAERGHCTHACLQRLNPGRDLRQLASGDTVVLPNVEQRASGPAASLVVDLGEKTVRALDARGRTLALFHCSIAQFAEKRPRGTARVTSVAFDPTYLFRPEMWPEVKNVHRSLTIPAGPRNPVGLCWIDLSLPGYGIHGTPNPEQIGKTGSHGCIRLTNWDAVRLGRMVRAGAPVQFRE